MALAGQVHVAYTALRGAIESALYAFIMKYDPSSQTPWVDRNQDRKRCRQMFSASRGMTLLQTIDAPLAQAICESYETTIDRGAHPNVLSLGSHLDFDEWDAENKLANIVLLPADSPAVEAFLVCCVVIGVEITSLCAHVMPSHAPAVAAHDEGMEILRLLHERYEP
jgi:hypothetical protein